MKTKFYLKANADTPEVLFDKEKNQFIMAGRSMPEDAYEFYKPIIEWVKEYVLDPNPKTELNVTFEYFNSSSVKQVLELFMLFENLVENGKDVKIIWNYTEDDVLMEVKGQELKSMLSVPFEFKVIG